MRFVLVAVACLLLEAPAVLASPVDDVESRLPPETPACNNGVRVRACTHVSVVSDITAGDRGNAAAVCELNGYADFLFDDPLFATPLKGDFNWAWSYTANIGGEEIRDQDDGSFDGVPLYPVLGVYQAEGFSFTLESGDSFYMGASAHDANPVMLQVDEAYAYFEFTCP